LSSEDFLTYDSDLARGLVHFDQYAAGNQRRGFLGFLSAKQNARDNNKSPYSVEEIVTGLPNNPIVNELFFGDKKLVRDKPSRLSNVPGFLLVIKSHNGSQLLYLRDGYGKVLEAEVANNILDDIRLRLF
jgi:hypothetical protein